MAAESAWPQKVPHSGEDAPSLLAAHHVDDVSPELPQGMQVVNHEPAAVQIHDPLAKPNHLFQTQFASFHECLSQNETVSINMILLPSREVARLRTAFSPVLRSAEKETWRLAQPLLMNLSDTPIARGRPMDPVLSRASIRSYTPRPVSEEAIRTLLQAGMAAHSAGDQRPWHFVVIQDQEVRNRLAEIDPFAHMVPQAPVAILVCGDPTLQKHQGYWVQDCAAATENILIEANLLGLGAVWLGVYPVEGRVQSLRRLLSLPENVIPFALVPLGYPAEHREPAYRYDESRVHRDYWRLNGRQHAVPSVNV